MRSRVRFRDTDVSGRVFFTRYVEWFDEAIADYHRERGLRFGKESETYVNGVRQGVTFAIGEYHCRIERASQLDDMVEVVVTLDEVRPKVVKYEGKVHNEDGQTLLAHGYITLVCIDSSTGKSAEIPKSLREALERGEHPQDGA